MADAKRRFYWLKLKEDFFRQKEIKKLRKLAGGDTFTVIYLKMLLRSLKDDGRLYYEGIESDFPAELALDIDEDEDNVRVTVAFLLANRILLQNQDEYALLTAQDMTGSEGESAARVRRMRERKALLGNGDVTLSNGPVTGSNVEIEIEKRDRDRDRDEKRKRFIAPTESEVTEYAKERGYRSFSAARFIAYYESNGWKVGRNPMKDWKAAVRGWASRDESPQAAPQAKRNPALDYTQRENTATDYSGLYVDLSGYADEHEDDAD